MTRGKVARLARVGAETIRFYEKEGLIEEPSRSESGYRQYTEDAVTRIRFIQRAKELGFSLKEISELLSLRVNPKTSCADIRQKAHLKIEDINRKIGDLKKMKRSLERLAASCIGRGPVTECAIIDAFEEKGG